MIVCQQSQWDVEDKWASCCQTPGASSSYKNIAGAVNMVFDGRQSIMNTKEDSSFRETETERRRKETNTHWNVTSSGDLCTAVAIETIALRSHSLWTYCPQAL